MSQNCQALRSALLDERNLQMHPPRADSQLRKLMTEAGQSLGVAEETVAEMYKHVAAKARAQETVIPEIEPTIRIDHNVSVKTGDDKPIDPAVAKAYLSKVIEPQGPNLALSRPGPAVMMQDFSGTAGAISMVTALRPAEHIVPGHMGSQGKPVRKTWQEKSQDDLIVDNHLGTMTDPVETDYQLTAEERAQVREYAERLIFERNMKKHAQMKAQEKKGGSGGAGGGSGTGGGDAAGGGGALL